MHFLKILIIAALLAITTWAGLRGYAAWNYRAALEVTQEIRDKRQFTPEELDRADSHIIQALKILPNHPDYLELAGHLRESRASQPGVVGKEHQELLESAAGYYRQALSARPLWPHGWVNLLAVKDKLGQVDMEFNKALRTAAKTGSWTPRAQIQVIKSGLRHWDQLGAQDHELVQVSVKNALQIQPRAVFRVARDYARPDLLCPLETRQQQIENWCEMVQ